MPFEDLETSGTHINAFGVPVWDEGSTEHWDRNGRQSSATRTLMCVWGDRFAVIQDLLGAGTVVTGKDNQGKPIYQYIPPQPYPDAPWIYAESVDPEGVGVMSVGANGGAAYKYARLKVTYKIPDGLETGSLSIDYGGEMLTLPQDASCFQWPDATPVPSECNPALPITTAKLKITIKNLASIPTDTIMALIDHTNQDVFQGGPPETVVYHGATSEKKFTTTGRENFDLTHCWTYRGFKLPDGSTGGWNHFLRPNGGGYQRITRIDNGEPPFPPGDFSQLLNPSENGGGD